jgi:hypothetical protein
MGKSNAESREEKRASDAAFGRQLDDEMRQEFAARERSPQGRFDSGLLTAVFTLIGAAGYAGFVYVKIHNYLCVAGFLALAVLLTQIFPNDLHHAAYLGQPLIGTWYAPWLGIYWMFALAGPSYGADVHEVVRGAWINLVVWGLLICAFTLPGAKSDRV